MGEPKQRVVPTPSSSGVRVSVGPLAIREVLGGDARADVLLGRALADAGLDALPRPGPALMAFVREHLDPLARAQLGSALADEITARLAIASAGEVFAAPRGSEADSRAIVLVTMDETFAVMAMGALGDDVEVVSSSGRIPPGASSFVVVDGATVDALTVVESLAAAEPARVLVWRGQEGASAWRDRPIAARVLATSDAPPAQLLRLLAEIARRQRTRDDER